MNRLLLRVAMLGLVLVYLTIAVLQYRQYRATEEVMQRGDVNAGIDAYRMHPGVMDAVLQACAALGDSPELDEDTEALLRARFATYLREHGKG